MGMQVAESWRRAHEIEFVMEEIRWIRSELVGVSESVLVKIEKMMRGGTKRFGGGGD